MFELPGGGGAGGGGHKSGTLLRGFSLRRGERGSAAFASGASGDKEKAEGGGSDEDGEGEHSGQGGCALRL